MSKAKSRIAYYPGCSALTTEKAYMETALMVLERLGVEYRILNNAPCCGALETRLYNVKISKKLTGIIMRESGGDLLVTGCTGCYSTVKMNGGEAVHLLKLVHDMLDRVTSRIEREFKARVAVYYGCQALRPRSISIDDPEEPKIFEEVARAIGSNPVDFSYKSKCCGGPLMLRNPIEASKMPSRIIESARKSGAQCILTMCNLCHFMLDHYGKGLPVLHFTQPLAYTLGVSFDMLGLSSHITKVPQNLFT